MVGWLPVAFVLQSFDFSESMCEDVEEEEEEEEKKNKKKLLNYIVINHV